MTVRVVSFMKKSKVSELDGLFTDNLENVRGNLLRAHKCFYFAASTELFFSQLTVVWLTCYNLCE